MCTYVFAQGIDAFPLLVERGRFKRRTEATLLKDYLNYLQNDNFPIFNGLLRVSILGVICKLSFRRASVGYCGSGRPNMEDR